MCHTLGGKVETAEATPVPKPPAQPEKRASVVERRATERREELKRQATRQAREFGELEGAQQTLGWQLRFVRPYIAERIRQPLMWTEATYTKAPRGLNDQTHKMLEFSLQANSDLLQQTWA